MSQPKRVSVFIVKVQNELSLLFIAFMSGCNGKHAIKCRTRRLEWLTSHSCSHFLCLSGGKRQIYDRGIDIFTECSGDCMALISLNSCNQVNHHAAQRFPRNALCVQCKCQEGGRWRRFRHPQQPVCLCLFWWAMMKGQVDARILPLPRQLYEFLVCGVLLAREWRFAAWLLGTVGWSSQSPVCSLVCRAPRVSLVPEGETNNNKKQHCLARWSWSPPHSSFYSMGVHFSLRR